MRRRWLIAVAPLVVAGCGGASADLPAVFQVSSRPHEVATAFALGADRMVTVAHVVEGNSLRLRDGRRATVESVDQTNDLAVLSVPGLRSPQARLGKASGDVEVIVLRRGHITALPAQVRRAINARIRTPDGSRIVRRPALELAVAIDPGDSGAPVVAGDGSVVGVVFAQSSGRAGVAYAVSAPAALPPPPRGRG